MKGSINKALTAASRSGRGIAMQQISALSVVAHRQQQVRHASNKAVVYKGPGKVAVENIDFPIFELKEQKRK